MLKGTFYTPEPLGVCPTGSHWATIKAFTIIGDKTSKYGPKKDVVRFDLRINVDGKEYKIAPEYPLSTHPESNFRKLLVAVRVHPDGIADGLELNDLVDKAFNGHVYHTVKGNITHAGIVPLPPPLHACPCGKATLEGKDYCGGGNCKWSIDAQTPAPETCSYKKDSGEPCYNLAESDGLCTAHGGVQ